jgi:hypothetical protein
MLLPAYVQCLLDPVDEGSHIIRAPSGQAQGPWHVLSCLLKPITDDIGLCNVSLTLTMPVRATKCFFKSQQRFRATTTCDGRLGLTRTRMLHDRAWLSSSTK